MESKKSKILKPIAFYIIFFLFVLGICTTATDYDYDFWARLIAGMGVLQTGHVLMHDFLSYTPTHIWLDHEWGSGVIFYLTQHFFSSAGILILLAVLIFLMFFVVTKVVNLRGVKTTSAYNFLFYFFAFSVMSQNLIKPIRCQLFSFILFAVFLYILERARKEASENSKVTFKYLWMLPLLTIVWNNLHGGCVAGVGLILLYTVGEFLNLKSFKKILPYFYTLILCVLVLPINPWGFQYVPFLIKANTMPRPYVMEWWGLFSQQYMFEFGKFKIFALILLLTEFGVVIKQIRSKAFNFDKTKYIVLAVTLFLAIQHIKMIPLFVIASACFLYDDFYTAFNALTFNIFNKIANIKDLIVYGIILIFAVSNINAKAFKPCLTWYKYPVAAIEFIKVNNLKGNLLMNFGLGSYASYKLYPNNKIYMDGRYEEVYYDYMMPLLKKFHLGESGWDELLKKFPPDEILLERIYPVCNVLKSRKDWNLVFEDEYYDLFVKTKDVKAYKTPHLDIDYYKKTLFDTNINFVLQSKNGQ